MNRPETKGFRSKETHVVDYYEYFRAMSRYADTLESQLKAEQTSINKLSLNFQELEDRVKRAEKIVNQVTQSTAYQQCREAERIAQEQGEVEARIKQAEERCSDLSSKLIEARAFITRLGDEIRDHIKEVLGDKP